MRYEAPARLRGQGKGPLKRTALQWAQSSLNSPMSGLPSARNYPWRTKHIYKPNWFYTGKLKGLHWQHRKNEAMFRQPYA